MNKIVSTMAASFLAFVLFSCGGGPRTDESEKDSEEVHAQQTANVEVMMVTPKRLSTYLTVTGETAPRKDVTYSGETNGRLDYLVPLGATVKENDVLACIDYDTLKAQADQAKASYSLAWKTYDRFNSLREEDLASQQQFDEAYSQMIQAKSQKTIAETNLKNSKIRARFNATVVERYQEEGGYVVIGAPLVRAIDLSEILVEAQVPESQVSRIDPKSPVKVFINSLNDEFSGVIDVIVPVPDPKAKTYLLRVVIKNPERKILAGMAAQVKIETEMMEESIVIPQETVLEKSGERTVFVEKNGKAEERKVVTGATHEGSVVILDGLASGDTLIVTGHRGLEDGQPVRIVAN